MQMELTAESTAALAKAIARANLTAHDDFVDEIQAGFPEGFNERVRDDLPGPERLKAAKELQRAADKFRAEQERSAAVVEKLHKDNAEKAAAFDEQEALRFEADQAKYKANLHAARVNGTAEPEAPAPVRSYDEAQREASRTHQREVIQF